MWGTDLLGAFTQSMAADDSPGGSSPEQFGNVTAGPVTGPTITIGQTGQNWMAMAGIGAIVMLGLVWLKSRRR